MENKFNGTWTALITPFLEDGSIDYESLKNLVDMQIEGGVSGIVSVGTTGESPTLSKQEHLEVIAKTVEFAAGKIPVWAGTGSNSTKEAVFLSTEAQKAGVSGILVVAPYYNKPSQEGVFLHFNQIAKSVTIPVILYSIPGRCGIEISTQTAKRLYEACPNICVIKEAGGSCDKVSKLISALDENYTVLSGDDGLTLPFMSLGAKGVVSVASNIFPKEISQMVNFALNNDYESAKKIAFKFEPLFKNLFVEPNPVPAKYVLHKLGIIKSSSVRLPLCQMTKQNQELLDLTLKNL